MKKLEDKILSKVYQFETRRTIFEVIIRIAALIVLLLAGIFVFQVLYTALIEQKTLDVLQIFAEDIETIRDYFGEVLSTLYEETPKDVLLLLVAIMILLILAILTLIVNFEKIKRRTKSILKFWFRH